MAWKKDLFGNMPDGREVYLYTLTNQAGMEAGFTTLGGTWVNMVVPDREGKKADILQGCGTVDQLLLVKGHMGEIIGRNANRIGGAEVTIAGKKYELAVNSGAHNNIHSGPDFYSVRIWDAAAEDMADGSKVTFSLNSPDGDQGYPGNAKIDVTYTLKEDGSLILEYNMVSDADTIANFTNHAYFNLAGHDSGSVLQQKAWIDADTFTLTDIESVPTGEFADVKGTPMDFTEMKVIGEEIGVDYQPLIWGNGYDHNWVLNHKKGELALSAKLEDPVSGRVMEVYTDLPGIQFYTANFLKDVQAKGGAVYQPRTSCCFETQYFPDCAHKDHFDGPYLAAGEQYHTVTIYKFISK